MLYITRFEVLHVDPISSSSCLFGVPYIYDVLTRCRSLVLRLRNCFFYRSFRFVWGASFVCPRRAHWCPFPDEIGG